VNLAFEGVAFYVGGRGRTSVCTTCVVDEAYIVDVGAYVLDIVDDDGLLDGA
jgi:hypothetical protein